MDNVFSVESTIGGRVIFYNFPTKDKSTADEILKLFVKVFQRICRRDGYKKREKGSSVCFIPSIFLQKEKIEKFDTQFGWMNE